MVFDHELKAHPVAFGAVEIGMKTCDIRHTRDRVFRLGQHLRFREWNPLDRSYTGREIFVRVTHIVEGGQFGLPDDLVALSIKRIGSHGC